MEMVEYEMGNVLDSLYSLKSQTDPAIRSNISASYSEVTDVSNVSPSSQQTPMESAGKMVKTTATHLTSRHG